MPRPATAPIAGPELYQRLAERELAVAEVLAEYYRLAAGQADPAAREARARLEALRAALEGGEPIAVDGGSLTTALAELGGGAFDRYGCPPQRAGVWRVHADGRAEPLAV